MRKAILWLDILGKKRYSKKNPFFILVEGSQIDWGGHDRNLNYVISEFKEFNKSIQNVLK